jgi:hypothetical protein
MMTTARRSERRIRRPGRVVVRREDHRRPAGPQKRGTEMSVTDPYDELKQHLSEAKERFAADREGATMTVLKDDGIYRHLTFAFPKAS